MFIFLACYISFSLGNFLVFNVFKALCVSGTVCCTQLGGGVLPSRGCGPAGGRFSPSQRVGAVNHAP